MFVCVFPDNSLVTTRDQRSLPALLSVRGVRMPTDCEFYLTGLSGTVLEIVGSWKAIVGFRRSEKEEAEKAVLLGLYSSLITSVR